MIILKDLLRLSDEQVAKAKVRFLIDNGENDPIELYKNTPDLINKEWLYWRNDNRFFDVGQIAICLVRISGDDWLLTTVDTVTEELGVDHGINYKGMPFDGYTDFYGRIIVHYHKDYQSSIRVYADIANKLEVQQVLPCVFDDDDFPGYDKVKLTYTRLKSILDRGKKDWINALENQKAVYLITDTSNGKLYVGSATGGNGMLLQRWRNYADNGHGGNEMLRAIVDRGGIEYAKHNFQYSILENYNARVDDHVILERESWWKDVLMTREFGYNAN